jgi:hypothetical protein
VFERAAWCFPVPQEKKPAAALTVEEPKRFSAFREAA